MKDAPKEIPQELIDGYSMKGKVKVRYKYRNDVKGDNEGKNSDIYSIEKFNTYLKQIKNKEWSHYGPTDGWLYQALQLFPIENKNVLIIGSTTPWYEAVTINYGAKKCTVLEYRKQETFHPQIEYVTPDEIGDRRFDVCISISSVEHDGLGRYGDPLNPDADLEHMDNLKNLITPGGLLYLAVPIGKDQVIFNLHRVYGRVRFNKLTRGWKTLIGEESVSFKKNRGFDNKANGINGTPFQPIFVLQNEDPTFQSSVF
tara:strand:+ start:625 stop:1395 length:771 start_codon:yes stop_codon:yes gene_type:complete